MERKLPSISLIIKKKRISFDNFVPKIVNGNFNYSENFQIPLSKKRN